MLLLKRSATMFQDGCGIQTEGRVAEWLKASDSKSEVVARLPWVRIPPLPPLWLIYHKHPILRMGLSAETLRQAANTKATSPRESLDPPRACCVLGGTRNGFLLTGSGAGAARFEAWCWPAQALPCRTARGFAPLRIRCFPRPRPRRECASWLPTCFRR